MVAVSYDAPETLAKAAEKLDVRFPLLSDVGSATIRAYGVLNEAMTRPRFRGIPHPTVFVIDAQGAIRAVLGHADYKERHSSDEVLAAAKAAL